jgi:hypothetical protein
MTGLVTNAGLAAVVDALIAGDVKYIGWGGGSGQDDTATGLASEFAESRTTGTMAATTTNTTDDTLRVQGTILATAPRTVTEVGVFSAPTGAELAIYGDFPAIDLATNDSIAFTIDVVVDQAT